MELYSLRGRRERERQQMKEIIETYCNIDCAKCYREKQRKGRGRKSLGRGCYFTQGGQRKPHRQESEGLKLEC